MVASKYNYEMKGDKEKKRGDNHFFNLSKEEATAKFDHYYALSIKKRKDLADQKIPVIAHMVNYLKKWESYLQRQN